MTRPHSFVSEAKNAAASAGVPTIGSSRSARSLSLISGFCTPGLLVAAKALLDRNPNPTEIEARYWLAGNLCRCTGYDKVIRAVLDAAAELRAG